MPKQFHIKKNKKSPQSPSEPPTNKTHHPPPAMSTRDEILDQIDSLQNLLDDGIMDEEQYQAAKDKLLKKLEELENEEKQPPKTTSTAGNAAKKQPYDDDEDDEDHYNGGGNDEVDPYDAYDAVDDSAVTSSTGGDVIESYLDTHERLLQTMKQTKATEASRWGKSGQVFVSSSCIRIFMEMWY